MRDIAPAAAETLLAVGRAMRSATEPWWLIGSAAMALHGARPIEIADVDLMVSRKDALPLLKRLGARPLGDTGNELFRSAIFGRWTEPPLIVEIMADFSVRTEGGWQPVWPETRETVRFGQEILYVPSVAELIAQCCLFGRPKDGEREKILREL
ncbi:MAG: hypothetical protein H0W74_03360 [Sphingosinicella sp.]|nr:hypothetical protein [Sphingosinicella sp.]